MSSVMCVEDELQEVFLRGPGSGAGASDHRWTPGRGLAVTAKFCDHAPLYASRRSLRVKASIWTRSILARWAGRSCIAA